MAYSPTFGDISLEPGESLGDVFLVPVTRHPHWVVLARRSVIEFPAVRPSAPFVEFLVGRAGPRRSFRFVVLEKTGSILKESVAKNKERELLKALAERAN